MSDDKIDLSNLMDTVLAKFDEVALKKETSNSKFWAVPVSIDEFIKSKEWLGENLFPRQLDLVKTSIEILLHKWFKLPCRKELEGIQEMVAMLGKGAGKDFMLSIIFAYAIYVLMCLKDPQGFFGLAKGEEITLINTAPTSDMAVEVFLSKLESRLDNIKWFQRVGTNPSRIHKSKSPNPRMYHVASNNVMFMHKIQLVATHAESGSFEGKNPILVVYDEIDQFPEAKAREAYLTYSSSLTSRFQSRGFQFFISWPRRKDGFIMTKYEESQLPERTDLYGIRGATWDFNQSPGQTREAYSRHYEEDRVEAEMRYETIPPLAVSGFFEYPEKIDEVVLYGKESQTEEIHIEYITSEREGVYYASVEITGLESLNKDFTYHIGVDAGVISDAFILCLAHTEVTSSLVANTDGTVDYREVVVPVEDLIVEWRPDKGLRIPVDLINVEDIILKICETVNVQSALFDSYQSSALAQKLANIGVEAEDKQLSNAFQMTMYKNLKGLIYARRCKLLDYHSPYEGAVIGKVTILSPNEELKYLNRLITSSGQQKIDHSPDKCKDMSDARACAFFLCVKDSVAQEDFSPVSDVSIVGARKREATQSNYLPIANSNRIGNRGSSRGNGGSWF